MTGVGLLELRGVGKHFGETQVLNDATLHIEEHTATFLIGPSGSGKSTLLRCINGLEKIDSGSIWFCGQEVSGEGVDLNAVRRWIGIVFQSYNLFPHMTVLQNITLAPTRVLGIPLADARDRGMELLERVGLSAKADTYADRLSGGQQQRVAIVRSLAMHPKLILLDEVTSALDPELVGEVLGLIRELITSGMTMLLATHEMAFARELATNVCFLDGGRIVEQGPPEQIFTNPAEERTRAFLRRVL